MDTSPFLANFRFPDDPGPGPRCRSQTDRNPTGDLQNRRVASDGVTDGFDSHSLPPFCFSELCGLLFASESETSYQNRFAVMET